MTVTLWMDCFGSGQGVVSAVWTFEDGRGSYTQPGGYPVHHVWYLDGPTTLERVLREGRWVEDRAEAVRRFRADAMAAKKRAERALAEVEN